MDAQYQRDLFGNKAIVTMTPKMMGLKTSIQTISILQVTSLKMESVMNFALKIPTLATTSEFFCQYNNNYTFVLAGVPLFYICFSSLP